MMIYDKFRVDISVATIVRTSGNYDDLRREQDARTNCKTPTSRLLYLLSFYANTGQQT
ncbi:MULTISPECIES: hypothetical protein [Okeania]|uniref:hypothetical protein n=1 Tax=Okeania TaxID=1458928 RepID=UPI0013752A9B|nr:MULTISPECIES: hypothetical protein [Okeania]NES79719.1 hypothetical protein [Okeania sp. SIO1H4]NES90805.1 hypothetical protein [Okeania sp. SIO2B9]NET23401.1 hypothetical protein [Okeania sp. SIO1H5]NET80120.1 hypothetical protein [Okeania sp. SIO1F9]NET97241.1 hypothetical protein [Okeania sp. SIO1H2]